MEYLTPAAFATLFLEIMKWVIRNWILKQPDFDFPAKFYIVAVPLLTTLMLVPAAFLLPDVYTMPTDWVSFGRLVGLTLVNGLMSVVFYNTGIKPTKVALRGR